MYKWKNRFLAFIMAIILTFSTVPSALATEIEVFHTSNFAEENIEIAFQGNNIVFKDFPDREEFNYVMLSLQAENGGEYLRESYSTESDITMSVAGLEDGIYYVQMYRAAERYTSYAGYMWGENGVKLNIQNGIVTYEGSPVYEHNKKVFESNVTNKALFECYLKPSNGIESDDKKIIKLAKSIVSDSDSDYEKVRKIHDWVAGNVWYDYDSYGSGSYGNNNAIEVVESKKAVCQGYANLAAALLRALGIPAKVVSGYSLGVSSGGQWTESLIKGDKTNHAWNEAFVDGRWVIFDATWDSNNEYRKGEFSKETGLNGYKYFDPTIENFSNDHKIVENENELAEIAIDSIDIDYGRVVLYKNNKTEKAKKITPKVGKYNGVSLKDYVQFTYKSDNPSIVKVNKKGKVTAKKTGSALIYVTAKAGGWTLKWTVNVTVK